MVLGDSIFYLLKRTMHVCRAGGFCTPPRYPTKVWSSFRVTLPVCAETPGTYRQDSRRPSHGGCYILSQHAYLELTYIHSWGAGDWLWTFKQAKTTRENVRPDSSTHSCMKACFLLGSLAIEGVS